MSAISSQTSSNTIVAQVSQPLRQAVPARQDIGLLQQATPADNRTQTEETANEFVRVSSSIGRAASAGQLSREEAVAIYRQIASLL